MKSLKIDENSQNYPCSVVTIGRVFDIVNADALKRVVVFANDVVVSKDTKEGDVMLYFQAGTQLSEDVMRIYNLNEDNALNEDTSVKGYVSSKRRLIKAIKLRGTISDGILLPISKLSEFLGVTLEDGDEFTHVNDIEVCKKYVVPKKGGESQNTQLGKQPKANKLKELLVDNQFRFHHETEHFAKNLHKFQLDTEVIITRKYHGSSLILSRVLIQKQLSWIERMIDKYITPIPKSEYGYVFSSGKPKSRLPKGVLSSEQTWNSPTDSFYSENIWKKALDLYRDCLESGITLYGEIVGDGIQGPEYTYGFPYKIFIYRITQTNVDGVVYEFSWEDVKRYCDKYGISYVDEYFVGKVSELISSVDITNEEHPVLEYLKEAYLDKSYPDCKVDEGICIRHRGSNEIFKLKSPKFIMGESAELEKGIENES